MIKDEHTTKMAFRKFNDGDVIALFIDEPEGGSTCQSYMHVGQHGPASESLFDELQPASEQEYTALKEELTGMGYLIEVVE